MKKKNTVYYLIKDRIVGKKEGYDYYIFRDGAWRPDKQNMIRDRLIGYDPFEPDDSPYWCGSLSVMEEIKEISYETAEELIRSSV